MIFHGWLKSLVQVSRQTATVSSEDLKVRFDSQLPRMSCQTLSMGVSTLGVMNAAIAFHARFGVSVERVKTNGSDINTMVGTENGVIVRWASPIQ